MKLSRKYTTVTPLSKFLAMVLFILLPFIAFYLGMQYQKGLDVGKNSTIIIREVERPEEKACTLEAKICDDGSTVGRTGPNCEFEKCPGE